MPNAGGVGVGLSRHPSRKSSFSLIIHSSLTLVLSTLQNIQPEVLDQYKSKKMDLATKAPLLRSINVTVREPQVHLQTWVDEVVRKSGKDGREMVETISDVIPGTSAGALHQESEMWRRWHIDRWGSA